MLAIFQPTLVKLCKFLRTFKPKGYPATLSDAINNQPHSKLAIVRPERIRQQLKLFDNTDLQYPPPELQQPPIPSGHSIASYDQICHCMSYDGVTNLVRTDANPGINQTCQGPCYPGTVQGSKRQG